MKRMKPIAYRKSAADYVAMIEKWLPLYGEWNLRKIMDEVEKLLRDKRRTR